jgi:hypothetical protein
MPLAFLASTRLPHQLSAHDESAAGFKTETPAMKMIIVVRNAVAEVILCSLLAIHKSQQ